MASELRNHSLSIYYRCWQIILQQGYTIDLTTARLTRVTDRLYRLDKNRAFVFINEDLDPWPSGVIVKQGSSIIPSGQYRIDYRKAEIHFPTPQTGNFDVDAKVFTCSIIPANLTNDELKEQELPIASSHTFDSLGRPFAIGTAELFRNRSAEINILARSDGELDDLMDHFERYLAHIVLANFSQRQPIKADGSLDLGYRFADQVIRRLNQRVKPFARKVPFDPNRSSTDKERYKAQVIIETETVS